MILVTGGAGFIGSHLVDRLLARGEEIVVVDDFNDYYDPAIKRANVVAHQRSRKYQLFEADIRDRAAMSEIFERQRPRKVVHLAARAGVRPSLKDPFLYEDVNVRGTLNLLELSRLRSVEQFVFASSSSVYGASDRVPFAETQSIDRTISPYAATKYAGELFCHTYHHLYSIPITCLRFFTAYGPRQRPEMAIHKFTRHIFEGRPIPMYGDGSSARDYTYIDDIVAGLVAAIDRPMGLEVINLGESRTVTLRQLIDLLERMTGIEARIEEMPAQPGDVDITCADISKARQLLDYDPATPIEAGLERFLGWYAENR